jgi:hypothetical protein
MCLAIDAMHVPQWCRGMAGSTVAAVPHILDCAVCYRFLLCIYYSGFITIVN